MEQNILAVQWLQLSNRKVKVLPRMRSIDGLLLPQVSNEAAQLSTGPFIISYRHYDRFWIRRSRICSSRTPLDLQRESSQGDLAYFPGIGRRACSRSVHLAIEFVQNLLSR